MLRLWKAVLLAVLCVLPFFGYVQLCARHPNFSWVFLAYPCASAVSFLQYWGDKSAAKNGRWRISNVDLHLVQLFGGWPGAFIAQEIFRHKSRKLLFQLNLGVIIAAHNLLYYWLLPDGFVAAALQGAVW